MKLLTLKAWKSARKEDVANVKDTGIAMTPLVTPPAVLVVDAKRSNIDVLKAMLVGINADEASIEKAMDTAEPEDTIATYTMSTDAIDRPGDKISQGPEAWDLRDYAANPVFLFGHDAGSLPIGKALAVTAGKSLRGTFKFAPEATYPFGATVGRMVKGGFLPACSVGFMPVDIEVAKDRGDGDDWFPPINFLKSKLLELSAVPIPANQEALLDAKGIPAGDAAAVREWAERCLAGEGGRTLSIPRATIERMAKLGQRSTIVVEMRNTKSDDGVEIEIVLPGEEEVPDLMCPDCGRTGPASDFVAPMEGEDEAPMEDPMEDPMEPSGDASLPIASKGWHPEFASADELRSFVDHVTKAAVASALTAHTGRLPD